MIYPPEILDALQVLAPSTWRGTVYRHVFANRDPTMPNQSGARWNPPDLATLYCALQRDTAVAEGDHVVAVQGLRMKASRWIHSLDVEVRNVLDLTADDVLAGLGLPRVLREADDHTACRTVGGAAAWLGHDAILVPSARHDGNNLVVFMANLAPDAILEPLERTPR